MIASMRIEETVEQRKSTRPSRVEALRQRKSRMMPIPGSAGGVAAVVRK